MIYEAGLYIGMGIVLLVLGIPLLLKDREEMSMNDFAWFIYGIVLIFMGSTSIVEGIDTILYTYLTPDIQ